MNIKKLSDFLKKAKRNSYASETAIKTHSLRPGSKDYEYTYGDMTYHDTYFGGVHFIGEEIVYENGKVLWGMNYNGFVLAVQVTEEEIDKSLRAALKQDTQDLIPVRGPAKFTIDNYTYMNTVKGDLERFEGREEVTKDGKLIYYAVFHGGMIK